MGRPCPVCYVAFGKHGDARCYHFPCTNVMEQCITSVSRRKAGRTVAEHPHRRLIMRPGWGLPTSLILGQCDSVEHPVAVSPLEPASPRNA